MHQFFSLRIPFCGKSRIGSFLCAMLFITLMSSCESEQEKQIRLEKERQEPLAEGARVDVVRKEQEDVRLAEDRVERLCRKSLKTGVRPFSCCWISGVSEECGLEVTSAAPQEVLVTMKRGDEKGPAFGPVYLAAGGTGSVKVDPGVYPVFFSQGKGRDAFSSKPMFGTVLTEFLTLFLRRCSNLISHWSR